jgi:hypothetical protein
MKRFFFLVVILLCAATAVAQQPMFFETDASAILSRNATVISGDTDLNLQEAGLSSSSTLKTISIVSSLSPDLRVRYTCVLPFLDSGNGQLLQQIILNGITYGPKDSNETQHRDIFTQYRFTDHRFDIDFMPLLKYPSGQIYFVGSLQFAMIGITLRGVPNTSGSGTTSSSSDVVETSISANKTFAGIGLGGYQRQGNLLFKSKVVYDFSNGGRGWIAQADLRYEVDRRGFIGVGYYFQDLNVPLDTMRLKNQFNGVFFQVGGMF